MIKIWRIRRKFEKSAISEVAAISVSHKKWDSVQVFATKPLDSFHYFILLIHFYGFFQVPIKSPKQVNYNKFGLQIFF